VVEFAPCGHAAACSACAAALTAAAKAAQAPLRCPACRRVAAGTRAAGALF
jgi:primosomal protein N'